MKPTIAIIASYPPSLITFRLALMREFLARGYKVTAIAPYDKQVADELASHQINYINVPLQRNGINPLTDLSLILRLKEILKRENPTAVFSYTIKPIIYGSIAAKLAKVSKIYSMITGTGYVFLNVNLKSRIVGFVARKLFRIGLHFNTLVFFQNPDNLEFFRSKKIIAKKKPATVINGSGVDCNTFSLVPFPEKISFLMIARFLYDKGICEYIEAAKIIRKKYPQVIFKLVGWIDTNPNSISEHELQQWIEEGVIEYLGKLSDVREAISSSSVYVLPSYHEGTPRTVLEAMAMGRPIITTDAPGCKDTVVHEKTGLLVQVKDIEQLIAAIEYYILNPHKINEMGFESRKYAVEKYDVNKVNQSILTAMRL